MKLLSKAKSKELNNKTCLLRVDLNIKSLKDEFRIDSVLPTIKYLLKYGSKVIILSHRGRPTKIDNQLSLKPIAEILSKKIKKEVCFISHFNFKKIKEEINSNNNKIFILENLRFLQGEEKNNKNLAKELANLGDIYINDAFAVSHRKNTSVFAITKYIKSYAGLLLEKEISGLTKATRNPEKPLIVILGGTKIDDKINIVCNLNSKTKYFLLGSSVLNELKNIKVSNIIKNKKCLVPIDFAKKNNQYFDIGPETLFFYKNIISEAGTIIWNGPVGKFEDKKYSKGTIEIAKAVTNSKAFKVIGGGETANFILKKKMNNKVNLLSTGGGAMLDFLSGKKMPGIEALK